LQKVKRNNRAITNRVNRRKGFIAAYPDIIIHVSLFALAALIFLPVLTYSLPNGDDMAQHCWWAREFIAEIREGTLYPRWLSGAYDGRGSPVMIYYPPLPFFVIAFFSIFTANPLMALALGCWIGLAISGSTMYLLSRSLLSRQEAIMAAGFYMILHYHLFDFFHRSAQHEFWAFAWVPLLLYGLYRISTEHKLRALPYVAFSYAMLLVTHVPTALMITFVTPFYLILLTRDIKRLISAASGLITGAGMAGIFIIPFLFERDYLKSLGDKTDIQRFDAGFLMENLGEAFQQIPFPSSGNFHLFILAGDWIALGLLILLVAITWVLWKSEYRHNPLVRGTWFITIFSLLMTTRISSPLWQFIPKFKSIQFPIRWLLIVSLGASLLTAIAVSFILRHSKLPVYQATALGVAIIFNLAISGLVLLKAPFQPEALQKRLAYYTDVREYHPKWWDQQRHTELDKAPAVVDQGNATVVALDKSRMNQSYTISASEDSVLRFRTLYFPGWTARIDGQVASVAPSKDGHIELKVISGEHNLTLDFEDTPTRTTGKIISALSLIIFAVILYAARRSGLNTEQTDSKVADRNAKKRSRKAAS
jgi:uncharacterized membrane protein